MSSGHRIKVSSVKVIDGKLVRKKTYMAGKRKLKSDRLVKAWANKNPRRSGG